MPKPNILIVDDDKDSLSYYKEFLEGKGYCVKTTSDPDTAIKKLKQNIFSAVLLDLRLYDEGDNNDFSGLDLANRIAQFSSIPKFLLTKYKSYDAATKALSTHLHKMPLVADIILKQDSFDVLLHSLENVLLPKKIFLSYVREDEIKVRKLYKNLEKAGFHPWMDVYNIRKGTNWELAIERAISETDFFVICISKSSQEKRGYFRHEVNKAIALCLQKLDDDVFLIPLRLDQTSIKDESLRKYQWINYYEPDGLEQILEALRAGGRHYLYSS